MPKSIARLTNILNKHICGLNVDSTATHSLGADEITMLNTLRIFKVLHFLQHSREKIRGKGESYFSNRDTGCD